MLFPSSATVFSSACLLGMVMAAPTNNIKVTGSLLSRQAYTECAAGSQWYVCAKNGFRGCCTVDPCDLDSCPSETPAPPACPADGRASIFEPKVYNILPERPDQAASGPINAINLAIDGPLLTDPSKNPTEYQQVLVFEDIPATAKNCVLLWGVAEARNFSSDANGLTSVLQLNSIPQEPISANSVKALGNTRTGGADFTNWAPIAGVQEHLVGGVECKTELAFHTSINRVNGDVGYISVQQNSENGWYLSYDC